MRLFFFVHALDAARVRALTLAAPPTAFQSEIDHGLVQPYLVARDRGVDVALTSSADARPLVLHGRQIAADPALRASVEAHPARVLVLRGSTRGPLPGEREIASDTFGARGDARVVPPLPQIGLVARDLARGARVERVVTKGWRRHQPSFLLDGSLASRLAALGVTLDGAWEDAAGRARWPDFATADVVLAVRSDDELGPSGETGKPPTRLVNAWCAGAIPVVAREGVYLRLGRDGEDMVVAPTADAIVEVVLWLRESPHEAERLFAASRARGAELSWSSVAARYAAELRAFA